MGDIAEHVANARLIAAAPELLSALCMIAGFSTFRSGDPGCKANLDLAIATAKAAIAKATAPTSA